MTSARAPDRILGARLRGGQRRPVLDQETRVRELGSQRGGLLRLWRAGAHAEADHVEGAHTITNSGCRPRSPPLQSRRDPAPVPAPTAVPAPYRRVPAPDARPDAREAALAAAAAAVAAARVEACRTLCTADPECLSFEIATEREHDYHGFNCCLEYTHAGDKKAPNLWLGPDDVDGKRCENRVRGWTT